jgi:hypothetical protein
MRIEEPVLRQIELFVPVDGAVWTGIGYLTLAFRLDRVDDHDPVGPFADRAIFRSLYTRRIVAMLAHDRQINDVHQRAVATLASANFYPSMIMPRHRRRVAHELVIDMLVLVGQRTQIAVRALSHVDDQIPFIHLSDFLLLFRERNFAHAPFFDFDLATARAHRMALLNLRLR